MNTHISKIQLSEAFELLRHQYPDEHWLWIKQRTLSALKQVMGSQIRVFKPRYHKSMYTQPDIASVLNDLRRGNK